MLGEQVLNIFLCIKHVRLNWNFIVYDVQNATYYSHGAPCPARYLFPWLNTRGKVHISVWTIREYPKRHSSYLSDSGDTFLPLLTVFTCFFQVRCTVSEMYDLTFTYGYTIEQCNIADNFFQSLLWTIYLGITMRGEQTRFGYYMYKPGRCLTFASNKHYVIITDSVVLWKIKKFDWLIPETKWHSCLHNRALCSYLATLRLLRQGGNNPQFSGTY